jgi:hypothetical protein
MTIVSKPFLIKLLQGMKSLFALHVGANPNYGRLTPNFFALPVLPVPFPLIFLLKFYL